MLFSQQLVNSVRTRSFPSVLWVPIWPMVDLEMSSGSSGLEWGHQHSAWYFILWWLSRYPSCKTKSVFTLPSPRAVLSGEGRGDVSQVLPWPPQLVSHWVACTPSPLALNTYTRTFWELQSCGVDCHCVYLGPQNALVHSDKASQNLGSNHWEG